jgi:hypothetical protein
MEITSASAGVLRTWQQEKTDESPSERVAALLPAARLPRGFVRIRNFEDILARIAKQLDLGCLGAAAQGNRCELSRFPLPGFRI